MFKIEAFDETWGEHKPVGRPCTIPNYADMKALIVATVSTMIRDLSKQGAEYRYVTIREVPGQVYRVLVEWCPDGKLIPVEDAFSHESDYPEAGLQQAVIITGKVA
jgi:hypothetical protein